MIKKATAALWSFGWFVLLLAVSGCPEAGLDPEQTLDSGASPETEVASGNPEKPDQYIPGEHQFCLDPGISLTLFAPPEFVDRIDKMEWVQLEGAPITIEEQNLLSARITLPDVGDQDIVIRANETGAPPRATFFRLSLGCADANRFRVDLGPNKTAVEGAEVTLEPSVFWGAVIDPVLEYEWRQTAGPEVLTLSPPDAQLRFTAPQVDAETVLSFQVEVSDGLLLLRDTVDITITDAAVDTPDDESDETDGTEETDDTDDVNDDDPNSEPGEDDGISDGEETNPDVPLEFTIDADIVEGTAPLTVAFDAIMTQGDLPPDCAWEWTFDDASESVAGASAEHTFADEGVYVVKACAASQCGDLPSACAQVPITVLEPSGLVPVGLSVDPPEMIAAGGTGQFTATVTYSDGTNQDVTDLATWSMLMGPGTISAAGLYTAPASVSDDQTIQVLASYREGDVQVGSFAKSELVAAACDLDSISILGPAEVPEAQVAQYAAVAIFADGSTINVTDRGEWSLNGAGTLSNSGRLTTPQAPTGPVPVDISFTYTDDCTSVHDELAVSVQPIPRFIVDISEGPSPLNVQLEATTVDESSLPQGTYSWEIDDTQEAGPLATHGSIAKTFSSAGKRTIALTLTYALAGVTYTVGCKNAVTEEHSAEVTVWPSISGHVLACDNAGVQGVIVAAIGGGSTTSKADGSFSLSVPYGWSGKVETRHDTLVFDVDSREFATAVNTDVTDVEFVVNCRPEVENSSVSTPEETPISIPLQASDPEGDTLEYAILQLPEHGVLSDPGAGVIDSVAYNLVNNGDTVSYTPDENFNGSDRVIFGAYAGGQASPTVAYVTIEVTPSNDVPQIEQGATVQLTVDKDSLDSNPANQLTLSATDVDAAADSLTWTIQTQASHGSASIKSGSPSSSGGNVLIGYQPTLSYTGTDTFTLKVQDSGGQSDSLQVNVSVQDFAGSVYYVSTTGNDSFAGTAAFPFASIQHAVESAGPGDTIIVQPGTYPEYVTIRNGGLPGHPITIQGANWQEWGAFNGVLDTIVTGDRGGDYSSRCFEFASGANHVVLRGIITEYASKNISTSGTSANIVIEDCVARYGSGESGGGDGMNIGGQGPVTIRRCIIHENAHSGIYVFQGGIQSGLIEDCDSYGNGTVWTEYAQGFVISGRENFTDDEKTKNVTFRRCIAYGNGTGFGNQDTIDCTFEDCISWRTQAEDNSDGRGFIMGNHGTGRGTLVRRCVSFDNAEKGFEITNNPGCVVYQCTTFDNDHWGFRQSQADGVIKNICTFLGNPSLAAYSNPIEAVYSDSAPRLTDVDEARSLASQYEDGLISRSEFLSAFREAMTPAAGSPLIDNGVFVTTVASSGSGTSIPVTDNPTRRFVVGDQVQVDDGDNDPGTKTLAVIVALQEDSIVVDQEVSYQQGRGVHTPYNGNAPDIGAFESP